MNDIRQIAPGVVRIPTGISNAYLVRSSKQWALIDSGTEGHAGTIREAARDYFGKNPPVAIYLTHGHFDHAGSAGALSDHWNVPVLVHPLELPFVDGRSAYPPPDPTVGGFMSQVMRVMPNKQIDLGDRVEEMPRHRLAGLEGWDVIPTPGHTPGHVSFFRRDDRTLIAGDAFTTINQDNLLEMISKKKQVCRPPAYYTIDWEQAQDSVRRLARLAPLTLAAGHGEPMKGPDALRELQVLGKDIQAPEYGRYVRQPAETNEDGIVYLPSPVPDPVKRAISGVALGGAALGAALYWNNRRKRNRPYWEDLAA